MSAKAEEAQGEGSPGRGPEDVLVSVAIPAHNEERHIGDCLESILAQTLSDFEVIVVDNGSTDRTVRIVQTYAGRDRRIRLIHRPWSSIPASLNEALGAARGRWLVRIDAHSTVPHDYVERAVGHLRTGRWGAVGGRKDAVATTPMGRAIAAALGSRFGVGDSYYHYGTEQRVVDHVPFGAYPTELLRTIGGWDTDLTVNEDYELDFRVRRAGYRLLFDPELRIAWRSRETLADLFRQYRRYGRGKADVAWLHTGSVRPRHLAAPALVAAVVCSVAVWPRWPRLAALPLAPYAVALGAASLATARRSGGAGVATRVPLAFLAMHLGWGMGFWEGLAANAAGAVRRRRRRAPRGGG